MPRMRRDASAKLFANGIGLDQPKQKSNGGQCLSHRSVELELARWLVTPTMSNFDRYRRGSAELHLHFGIRSERHRNGETDFCAVSNEFIWPEVCGGADEGPVSRSDDDGRPSQTSTDCNEFTMLISILQAADDGQDALLRPVRQLIRLRTYDDCLGLRWKSVDGSQETFPSFRVTEDIPSVGVPGPQILCGDWESSICALASRMGSGYNDMIECTSQVVYEVTEHDGDHRIRLLNDIKPVSVDAVIAVWLPDGDGSIGAAVRVAPGFSADIYHMVLRPLELEPPGVRHEVYSHHEQQRPAKAEDPEGRAIPSMDAP